MTDGVPSRSGTNFFVDNEILSYQKAIALRDSTIASLRSKINKLEKENASLRVKASLVDHLQAQLDYEK